MSTGRFVAPGRTRSCPHCKATILDSAAVCPGCHHHLRFDSAQRPQTADTPLRVDGILRHTADGGAWEYSIVLAIRNGRGEEVSRQVVGVGALQPAEERTFSLAVEVFKPAEASKPAEAGKLADAPKPQATATAAATPTSSAARTGAFPSAAASPATAPRPPDPLAAAHGRIAPPGFGRDPARPQGGLARDLRAPGSDPRPPASGAAAPPPRSGGLADPRAAASDPKPYPKRS